MQRIFRREIDPGGYCLLLRSLHALYTALEEGLRASVSRAPLLAPLVIPELWRTDALAQDLDFLHGPDWAVSLEPRRSAERYRDRLETLARRRPALLASHAYVRYLGDLSAGRLLRELVASSLEIEGPEGLAFYQFDEPNGPEALEPRFREGLDGLPSDGPQARRIIEEAQRGFMLHEELFRELETAAVQLG